MGARQESQVWDVLIVGAGPVGLSLAIQLGQLRRKVLLIEKNENRHDSARAPLVWPKTQEVLAAMGLYESVCTGAILHDELSLVDADNEGEKSLLTLPFSELNHKTSFPQLLILPDGQLESHLYEKVKSLSHFITLKYGCRFQHARQNSKMVRIQYFDNETTHRASGRFLIGCDGAHSSVRKNLGIEMKGYTYSTQAAIADISLKKREPLHSPRISNKEHLAIALKISRDLWRLVMPYAPEEEVDVHARIKSVVQPLFRQQAFKVHWTSEFNWHNLVAEKFIQGRVLLSGDAAHIHSPVGGLGLNAGIQESQLLARALHISLMQQDLDVVEEYANMRKQEVKKDANSLTNHLTRALLLARGRYFRPLIKVIDASFGVPSIRTKMLKQVAMLDESSSESFSGTY